MHLAVCNWFLSYILRYGSVNRNLHKLGKWSETPDKRSRCRGKTFPMRKGVSHRKLWPKLTRTYVLCWHDVQRWEFFPLQPSRGSWNERSRKFASQQILEFLFVLAGCLQRLERTHNTRSHSGREVRDRITKWLFRVSAGTGCIPTRFNVHRYFTSRKSIF